MLISFTRSATGIVLRVKILDSSVSTGAGKTGLTSASSGLRIATIADNEASSIAYTVAGSTIDTIATLGTYATPTTNHCRFKQVDATNHPGLYEVQLADSRYAVANCKYLIVSITGATNAGDCDAIIPLTQVDPYNQSSYGDPGILGTLNTIYNQVLEGQAGRSDTIQVVQDSSTITANSIFPQRPVIVGFQGGALGGSFAYAVALGTDATTLHFARPLSPLPSNGDAIQVYYGEDAAELVSSGASNVTASGTAQGGTTTTITLATSASAVDNLYKGQTVQTTGGAGAGQALVVLSYVGSTRVATMGRAWAVAPDNTTTYNVLPTDAPATNASLAVATSTGSTGSGNVAVTHNTPTTDLWRVVFAGQGIANVTVSAYLTSVYTAGTAGPLNNQGQTTTDANGRWSAPLMLTTPASSTLNYTLVFSKPGAFPAYLGTITIDSSGNVTTP